MQNALIYRQPLELELGRLLAFERDRRSERFGRAVPSCADVADLSSGAGERRKIGEGRAVAFRE
jgi:hypothetical protein